MRYSNALKYRMKAAQLRAVAHDDEIRSTKSDLIRIAESYEKLAQSFENLERALVRPLDPN
jgi:hypothetical protein